MERALVDPSVFVSHSSADAGLVNVFVDQLIRLGCEVPRDRVFYSSGRDTGIPSGSDLNSYVRGAVGRASKSHCNHHASFLSRSYCLAELGAAWARAGQGGLTISVALWSDTGLAGRHPRRHAAHGIDDPVALDELHDVIGVAFGKATSAASWNGHRGTWIRHVEAQGPYSTRLSSKAEERLPRSTVTTDGWGGLFDSYVDSALFIGDETVARREIKSHIDSSRVIPSRYHYQSDAGADAWLRMCEEPSYRFHIDTAEFWADDRGRTFARELMASFGDNPFDFISLGPGDGRKDADLLIHWLAMGQDVIYYPYDTSLSLTSHAVRLVRQRVRRADFALLRVKAVVADFKHFDTLRQVISHRECPNIISLMGTLGNLEHEKDFLRSLLTVASRDDIIVLEVRLRTGSEPDELKTPGSLRHDFGPLEHFLGLPFNMI